jgi:hypothetical protein
MVGLRHMIGFVSTHIASSPKYLIMRQVTFTVSKAPQLLWQDTPSALVWVLPKESFESDWKPWSIIIRLACIQ